MFVRHTCTHTHMLEEMGGMGGKWVANTTEKRGGDLAGASGSYEI